MLNAYVAPRHVFAGHAAHAAGCARCRRGGLSRARSVRANAADEARADTVEHHRAERRTDDVHRRHPHEGPARNPRLGARGIYNGTAHWPEASGSIANCAVPVRGREATCTFSIPPRPGVYAAAFFHDEDSDREFDTGFLGIPLEGYAFSRDAHAALSAPSFASAAFRVPLRTPVSATMRY